ncbi:hypothetical protein CaCOL14_013094 [Colletotrichum acutatum]
MLFVSSARQILTPCVCGVRINAILASFQTLRLDQSRLSNDHLLPAGLAAFGAQPYSSQVSGCGSTMRHWELTSMSLSTVTIQQSYGETDMIEQTQLRYQRTQVT